MLAKALFGLGVAPFTLPPVVAGPQGDELMRGTFSDRGFLIADVNKTEIEQSRADYSYLANLRELNL